MSTVPPTVPGGRIGDAGRGSPEVVQRVVARRVIGYRLQVWASGGPLRDGPGERVALDVVAQSTEDAGGRYSVGHAVVNLHQHRPPIAFQALDDPAFPQRPIPVQAALEHIGDNSEQFAVIARPRHRDSAHVAGEIESRIVDPLRRTDVEGLGAEHLRAARNRLNTLCQNVFEFFKVGRGPFDDRDSADCQTDVTVRILRHQETSVERIELLHQSSPPFRRLGCVRVLAVTGGQRWPQY